MKLYLIPLFFIFLLTGNFSRNQSHTYCTNMQKFGDISICLPLVDGMVECYSEPKVKRHIDQYTMKGTENLGMYFNQDVYAAIDQLGQFAFDDYFKIYSIDLLKGINVKPEKLNELSKDAERIYAQMSLEELRQKISEVTDEYTLDKPLLIDTYSPHYRLRTLVVLAKMMNNESERLSVMTLSLVVIKNRLIYYTYVMDFQGEASIRAAKNKSNHFGIRFINSNQ